MKLFGEILVPLHLGFLIAWIYVLALTWTRFDRFRKSGYHNLVHILRATLWGELAIFAEAMRRFIILLADSGGLSPSWAAGARSIAAMLPVFVLMVICAVDAIALFRQGRFEALVKEHESRLQIGRLAARLQAASESLDQRNRDLERANLALAVAEKKFRDFFEHAPLHYHTLDRDGRILDSNELELRDLGYTREELTGQHVSKLMHPDHLEMDRAALQHFWSTGIHAGTEVMLRKKNGDPVPARLYSTAVRDEMGNIVAARTIWIDIAAQKQAEAEVANRTREIGLKNLELEARNRELSEVTHVISHDLKAPLRGIEAFLGFLQEDCGASLGATGSSHIATMQDSCRRLRRMIDDLIEYARFGQVGQMEPVSLRAVVDEVIAGLRLNLQARRAEIQVLGELSYALGDKTQLTVVVRNLLDNAIKYGRGDQARVQVGLLPDRPAGEITFFVRDQGIGIPAEHQEKIFHLFQRLAGAGSAEGSGMGLAMVKKAVEAHGGAIRVESAPGKGSTFFVTLPAPLRQSAVAPKSSQSQAGLDAAAS